jgi:hypothetical protein
MSEVCAYQNAQGIANDIRSLDLSYGFLKEPLQFVQNTLYNYKNKYFSKLVLPEMSESFMKNLFINDNITELSLIDENFNYILFNLLKILETTLNEYETTYKIDVSLETDEDNPNWQHADITVKLDDFSLGSEIWKKSSQEYKKFYESLQESRIIAADIIKRLHKFIYIIVD